MIEGISSYYLSYQHKFSENFRLRIQRSLRWLRKAEQESEQHDLDQQFISLWIAFNAIYAKDTVGKARIADKSTSIEFLEKIAELDSEETLKKIIFKEYSGAVKTLLHNKFTFQPFWDFNNKLISEMEWRDGFQKNKKVSLTALANQDTAKVMGLIFTRFYAVRSQMVHGGSTFNNEIDETQLKDCCNMLTALLPAMIQVMMNNHNKQEEWNTPFYPKIKEDE